MSKDTLAELTFIEMMAINKAYELESDHVDMVTQCRMVGDDKRLASLQPNLKYFKNGLKRKKEKRLF